MNRTYTHRELEDVLTRFFLVCIPHADPYAIKHAAERFVKREWVKAKLEEKLAEDSNRTLT
jgi:hypothetical protein